jgi:hypothetical protein
MRVEPELAREALRSLNTPNCIGLLLLYKEEMERNYENLVEYKVALNEFGVGDLLFGEILCSQITILPSAHKTQTFSPPICRTHPSSLSSSRQPNRNQENEHNGSSHQRSTTNLNPQQGKN